MDNYKILGRGRPADANALEIYECPVRSEVVVGTVDAVNPSAAVRNTQTMVTSIIVCNTGATTDFSITLLDDTTQTSTVDYALFWDTAIAANTTIALSLGLTLAAGNIIEVISPTAFTITFTAMGIEIT